MPLHIPCPHCDLVVELPENYLGAGVRCPRCGMVFSVQRAGLTAELPPVPSYESLHEISGRIADTDFRLPRSSRYEPGRAGLLLALGLSSLGVCVLGMIAGAFVCAAPLLFGPAAFVLGLLAWIKGHEDMEKLRLALIDPYAEQWTRLGWVSGITGTLVAVLLTLSGLCGAYLMLASMLE